MERICRQYILIVDVQADVTATNLFLRHFDGQQLVIGKGHLFHDNHIPIAVSECLARFQNQGWCQFDSLCVGCLGEFLVCQLYPYLINVKTDVRLVLDGKVYEEVVTHRVDIVQTHHHTVCFGSYVADFRR